MVLVRFFLSVEEMPKNMKSSFSTKASAVQILMVMLQIFGSRIDEDNRYSQYIGNGDSKVTKLFLIYI